MGKATGQHQLVPANDSGFFAAEGKLHSESRVENASYVITRIEISKAEHSLGSAW